MEIDEYFLQSHVSYYGLDKIVPKYREAQSIIKNTVINRKKFDGTDLESIKASCKLLYGLLHARYILTEDGIRDLVPKIRRGLYGTCPRVSCKHEHLIPCGIDNDIGVDTVKLYCPSCHDMYNSNSDIDGAFFGPDLPIMAHKMMEIPLDFENYNKDLGRFQSVPEIKKRLVRWGEKIE